MVSRVRIYFYPVDYPNPQNMLINRFLKVNESVSVCNFVRRSLWTSPSRLRFTSGTFGPKHRSANSVSTNHNLRNAVFSVSTNEVNFCNYSSANSNVVRHSTSVWISGTPRAGNFAALRHFSSLSTRKEHVNIGTIGHVDHGKTTLTSAITKYCFMNFADQKDKEQNSEGGVNKFVKYGEIDKLPEEKRRGITISSTHIEYETPKRHYCHIDCPGHLDFIKNMICGTAQMDFAILVVSALDGIMPQTREHVLLCRQLGIAKLVVFLNKVDLVEDEELLQLVELEVRELLAEFSYSADTPVVKGSALKALNSDDLQSLACVGELLEKCDEYFGLPQRDLSLPLILSVDDVLNIPNKGLVVTGKVEQGRIRPGDAVEVVGGSKNNLKSTVMGLETFRRKIDEGIAGEQVGVLLKNVKRNQISRGFVLSAPDSYRSHIRFSASLYLLKPEEGGRKNPIFSNFRPQLYLRTLNINCIIHLLNQDMAVPGDNVNCEIELINYTPLNEGLKFTLREGNKTIASGLITKLLE